MASKNQTRRQVRLSRALGIPLTPKAVKYFEKRPYPPGEHGRARRRTESDYAVRLKEKQRLRAQYGLREAQLRRYFAKAKAQKGNTGEILMTMCERRLDNVIRRAGFTVTRLQARQGVVHRHFQLNGKTIDKPSIFVRPGDVITLRNRPNLHKLYRSIIEGSSRQGCDWLQFDAKQMEARVAALPGARDVSLPVEIGQVVAFMSR